FWESGFGQTLSWRDRRLSYRMQDNEMEGEYVGQATQELRVKFRDSTTPATVIVEIDEHRVEPNIEDGWIVFTLPAASVEQPCRFQMRETAH
ncbi:MAG: hypothetical protein KC944_25435, partial [Candidatus Omnitrophica bacterium]|nr:hypothetical protein [Candidatus Omnitrophota bacterium]